MKTSYKNIDELAAHLMAKADPRPKHRPTTIAGLQALADREGLGAIIVTKEGRLTFDRESDDAEQDAEWTFYLARLVAQSVPDGKAGQKEGGAWIKNDLHFALLTLKDNGSSAVLALDKTNGGHYVVTLPDRDHRDTECARSLIHWISYVLSL